MSAQEPQNPQPQEKSKSSNLGIALWFSSGEQGKLRTKAVAVCLC